ncbi:MAG: anthranilate synthase component I family protein [Deltaproteobacteria bacterium]|nr:anthranilate synthase component I family protein [Deltaproteobacteria bacterium]
MIHPIGPAGPLDVWRRLKKTEAMPVFFGGRAGPFDKPVSSDGNSLGKKGVLGSGFFRWWPALVAFNPVEVCQPPAANRQELEAFVTRHTRAGHLVTCAVSYHGGEHLMGLEEREGSVDQPPPFTLAAYSGYISFEGGAACGVGEAAFADQAADILARQGPEAGDRADSLGCGMTPAITPEEYREGVALIQRLILAGNVYQVNLTYPWQGRTQQTGRELFARLLEGYPASCPAYLELPGPTPLELLSFSPEHFLTVADGRAWTTPIKGTRPRGPDPAQDAANRQALLDSPKEQAELNMITDLLRNDLGQVCCPGTLRVDTARAVQKLPTVWHTHSVVSGRLREDISPLGALLAMAPGGSITGAPKRAAMEIIRRLEARPRGMYTGLIGCFIPGGPMVSSIAIRTLVLQGGRLSLGVGSGITLGSDPEAEYQETLDKARYFLDRL